MSAPPVSLDVVVCTYNNARLLDVTLEALRAQRTTGRVDWRILVVDNNCTDDTRAVVARHSAVAPVPVAVVAEPEQGLTPARRRGVTSTSGDWIAFVDDDCILAPDWVEEAAAFAAAHPKCGGFGGAVVLDWEEQPPPVAARYGWAFAEQDHGPEPKRVGSLAGAGFVVRRAALVETGWIDRQFLADRIGEKLVSGGDVEMALRLGALHDLWYDPQLLVHHRIAARRATLGYLLDVTYGLGTSKLLGDTMLWPGTYRRWLVAALLASREWAVAALRHAARAALRRGGAEDAAVNLSFLRGWLAGIWRLARMPSAERNALLGLAVPRRS